MAQSPTQLAYDQALANQISPLLERSVGDLLDRALRPGASVAARYQAIGATIHAYHTGFLHAGSGHPLVVKANEVYEGLEESPDAMRQLNRTAAQKKMWAAVGRELEDMLNGTPRMALHLFLDLEKHENGDVVWSEQQPYLHRPHRSNPSFQVGDRVKSDGKGIYADVGTVTKVVGRGNSAAVTVRWDRAKETYVEDARELKHAV